MDAFDYGGRHPSGVEVRRLKSEADARTAAHYARKFRATDSLYLRGPTGTSEALLLFDREANNIRRWQAWAAEVFAAGVVAAAGVCRDFALGGVLVTDIRTHPAERIRVLEVGLRACLLLADRPGERKALNQLGVSWADLGETRKAIGFYERSLAIAREAGNLNDEKHPLSNLGNTWAALGEHSKAIEFHQRHLAIAREVGDRRAEGNALNNLGNAAAALRDFREAVRFHTERLTVAIETGDRRAEGQTLNNLGNAWYLLGDAEKAIDCHTRRLAIAIETGDRRGEGSARGNLGLVWAARGEHSRAIESYAHQLSIGANGGDRRAQANASLNLALSLRAIGRRHEAIDRAKSAEALFQAIDSPLAEAARLVLDQMAAECEPPRE